MLHLHLLILSKDFFVTVKILANVRDMFSYWIEQSKKVNDSHIKKLIKRIGICAVKEKDNSSSSIIKKRAICIFHYHDYYLRKSFLDFMERADH